jgi:DNA replication protein DnaC
MERLNDILARRRQQQMLQQRVHQTDIGALRERSAPSTRPPLPEQTARLGQPLARLSRPRVQVTELPSADVLSPPEDEPLARPRGGRTRPGSLPGRPLHADRLEAAADLRRETDDVYDHYEIASPSRRAAFDEDDWDEGMRYGDWEDEQELLGWRSAAAPEGHAAPPLARQSPLPVPPHSGRGEPLVGMREGSRPTEQRVTQPLRPAAPGTAYERLQGALKRQARQQTVREREREKGASQSLLPPAPREVLPAPLSAPRSICPKCKGAGYLRLDVPFGHPNFGKPVPCECKEADLKERRRQQLRSMSNLEAFRDKSFKNFNYNVPGVRQAYQAALEYVRDPDGWLLLIGPNGCGKTHLAAAIANLCLENGSLVLFATVPDLLDHLRAAFAPDSPEVYDQLFARMREAELLVLDDLGAQQSSPWANEKLFQLLNYRYNLRYPTVITANPRGLQAVDERIRSRLSDAALVTVVTFDGALDYRPRNPRRS